MINITEKTKCRLKETNLFLWKGSEKQQEMLPTIIRILNWFTLNEDFVCIGYPVDKCSSQLKIKYLQYFVLLHTSNTINIAQLNSWLKVNWSIKFKRRFFFHLISKKCANRCVNHSDRIVFQRRIFIVPSNKVGNNLKLFCTWFAIIKLHWITATHQISSKKTS